MGDQDFYNSQAAIYQQLTLNQLVHNAYGNIRNAIGSTIASNSTAQFNPTCGTLQFSYVDPVKVVTKAVQASGRFLDDLRREIDDWHANCLRA